MSGPSELKKPRLRKVSISVWDEGKKLTRREVREAHVVSVEEDLMVILGDGWPGSSTEIGRAVLSLLGVVSTLVTMTSAFRSTPTDSGPRSSGDRLAPSVIPVWADRRLDQATRRLVEDAEAVAGWLHRPFDPTGKRDDCGHCGGAIRRDDHYCRACGERTRRSE